MTIAWTWNAAKNRAVLWARPAILTVNRNAEAVVAWQRLAIKPSCAAPHALLQFKRDKNAAAGALGEARPLANPVWRRGGVEINEQSALIGCYRESPGKSAHFAHRSLYSSAAIDQNRRSECGFFVGAGGMGRTWEGPSEN
jgi:hypothetical protein